MSALHDTRVPRNVADAAAWNEAAELRIDVTPAYAWPVAKAEPKPSLWERFTGLVYRCLTPDLDRVSLANFSYLGPRLSRGAQPGRAGFRALAELGVDTVINLRVESPDEAALVDTLGMQYLYYPLDPLAAPTHAHVLAFLHTVCDPARGNIFFHCYHGADRTGVLAACYRIAHDQWSLEHALAELKEHHFHEAFQPAMLAYVRNFQRYWASLPGYQRDEVLHRTA